APAVGGEHLEVEHLGARLRERLQEAALAGPGGAADHPDADAPRERLQVRDHLPAKRLVAAVQPRRVPPDLAEHVGERAGTPAPAPAIDERAPVAGLRREALLDRARDVPGG